MRKETKKRIQKVLKVSKTVFHWGFIPLIIYLGRYSSHVFDFYAELAKFEPQILNFLSLFLKLHHCFVGLKQGGEPGMPEPTLLR